MKATAALLVSLIFAPVAAAFAPSQSNTATAFSSSALRAEVPVGVAPFPGFLGQAEWNRLTKDFGSADTGTYMQAAEIKHGRAAMLATLGFSFQKLGITFDKFTPHEYLSVTQNVKFADLAAMGPIEALKAIPIEGYAQVFFTIMAIEIYELTHRNGEIVTGASVAPGLQSGGLTGDLGWNPLKVKVDDRRRLVEIQNGRAAMFAITAWFCAETIPGSMPIPLPW